MIAGEYHVEQRSHDAAAGRVPMSILCRQSLAPHLDGDRLHKITTAGFDVFEKHFGYPYPFGKYDQVFVPEWRSHGERRMRGDPRRLRLREPANRGRPQGTSEHDLARAVPYVVRGPGHDEVVGRLVAQGSFATWAATFAASEALEDATSAWSTFSNGNKNWAYRQDQLPTTRPIAADMVDLEAIELNFDGITYAKGPLWLVQLVAFVGQDAFLKGLRTYFAEHAFGNTELGDLLRALERASGRATSPGPASGWRPLGSTPCRPISAPTRRRPIPLLPDRADGGPDSSDTAQSPNRDRALRGLETPCNAYTASGGRYRRCFSTAIPELDGTAQPDLLLPNDDD